MVTLCPALINHRFRVVVVADNDDGISRVMVAQVTDSLQVLVMMMS